MYDNLQSNLVVLRKPLSNDIFAINNWLSDYETWKNYSPTKQFLSFNDVYQLPENTYVITDRLCLIDMGFVSFRCYNKNRKEGLFDIVIGDKRYRKNGYAFDVTVLYLYYLFNNCNVETVRCEILNTNINSYISAVKMGFDYQKTTDIIKKNHEIIYILHFALTKNKFNNNHLINWYITHYKGGDTLWAVETRHQN